MKRTFSAITTTILALSNFLGVVPQLQGYVVSEVAANGNGLVVTKSVDKTDVWRDLPEDRLVQYEITVENSDACANAPIDAMLVMDRSGSMDDDTDSPYCEGYMGGMEPTFEAWCIMAGGTWIVSPEQPLQDAKNAAKDFIDLLSSPTDYAGLVSYSDTATLDYGLTSNHGAVKTAIDAMTADGMTNLGHAIDLAHGEFSTNGRQGAPDYAVPVMIVLTDGKANVGFPDGETYAEVEVAEAKAAGIRVIAIGLGDDVNGTWLENEIASSPSDYYYAPDGSDLADIFASIQATLGDSLETVLTDDISDILLDADFFAADMGGIFDGVDTITWDLGTLFCMNDRGPSSKTVHFSVVVRDDAPDGDIMDNMATATNLGGSIADSNTVHTEIHTLGKWDSDDPVNPEQIFTYTLEWATGDYPVDDVVITDYLDQDVWYVSSSDSGVYAPHTVTWHLGPKPAHSYGTVTLDVQVEMPWMDHNGDNVIFNEASVQLHYDNPPCLDYPTLGYPGDLVWLYENTDVEYVQLEVWKVDDPDPVKFEDQLTYYIYYENAGNIDAHDVWVVDTYDPHVSYVTASPLPDSGDNMWYIGTLAPDGSHMIEVTVEVGSTYDDPDPLTNLVEIYEEEGDYDDYLIDTEILDLQVEKVGDPGIVEAGGTLTYTITYKNNSTISIDDVVITDTYDANVSFVSSTPDPDGGTDNQWTLGTLLPGDSGVIVVTVDVASPLDDGTTLYNLVELAYTNPAGEDGAEYIYDDEVTEVNSAPVLSIVKSDTPDPVEAGQIISYTLTYENTGNMVASAVQVIDTLPAGLTYVAGTSVIDGVPVGDPAGTNPYTWDLLTLTGDGTLAPDGLHTLTFDVSVDAAIADGTVETDSATVNGTYLDQDEVTQNVSSADTEDTTVIAPVLDITKVNDAPGAGVNPGDTVLFTIVVTNSGGADATGVTITDTLPDGVTYVAGSSTLNGVAVGDPAGTNPYTWTVGILPANGGSATLVFDVTIDAAATAGAYSNASYADADNTPDPTDLVTSTFTVVIPAVLGEEVEPEGEVLGATGGAAIAGLLLGTVLLLGSVVVVKRKF